MRCIKLPSSSSFCGTRLMWNVNGTLPCCHSTRGISVMPLPTPPTSNSSSPSCHHRHVFASLQEQGVVSTCLLNAAHGLEVDVVAFPRSQRWVPETLVRPVVAHSKGGWLWQVSWGQLSSKVVWWASTKGSLIGDRDLIALHGTSFSLCSVWVQLFNNNLVGTGETEEKRTRQKMDAEKKQRLEVQQNCLFQLLEWSSILFLCVCVWKTTIQIHTWPLIITFL